MKFGKQLKLHSVPAWRENYMSYKRLKRVIAKLSMQMKMADQSISQTINQSSQSGYQEEKTESYSEKSPLINKQSSYGSTSQSNTQSNNQATLDRRPSISHLQRRLSQAYGSEGSDQSLNHSFNQSTNHSTNQSLAQSIEETEQRSIFVSDTKKEFYAIIENDIDKVNRFFNQTLAQAIDQLNRVQAQLDELGIDDINPANNQSIESAKLLDDDDNHSNKDDHTIGIGYQATDQSANQSINQTKPHKRKQSASSSRRTSINQASTQSINQTKLLESLSNRLLSLYKELLSLGSFSKLNFEGFRKIMKKYDKNCGSLDQSINQSLTQTNSNQPNEQTIAPINQSINQELMIARLEQESFMQTELINQSISQVERLINQLYTARGLDLLEAKIKLRTIKQLVDDPPVNDHSNSQTIKMKFVFIAIIVYLAIYFLPFFSVTAATDSTSHHSQSISETIGQSLNHSVDRAQKCAALLGMITTLWVTEAVPFYVSALLIPLMVILTGVLGDPATDLPLSAEKASKAAFSSMFNDTIMLILGGFSLSAAFSKCGFELILASINQSIFGSRPKLFLLSFMLIAAIMSMFISNVAAPVLCTSILLPIVNEYWASHQSSNQSNNQSNNQSQSFIRKICRAINQSNNNLSDDQKYAQCLLLGLAISCNIGGMMSPISSPQNAVALGFLENLDPEHSISFIQWCTVSVPYCLVCLLLSWFYLCEVFLGRQAEITDIPEILYEQRSMTKSDFGVIAVSLLTISLWCSLSYTRPYLGEMGTIAVIPMVAFFGSGFLTKADLLTFKWDLILLVGGGSVLGSAVNSSHLLQHISSGLAPHLQGQSVQFCVLVLLLLVFVITTFVSHTVAALILTPLIIHIGASANHTQLLTMAATLMMSGTMSLPTSSFPNINSLSQEDDWGKPFLHAKHFLIHGTAGALISWGVLNVFALTYMRLVFGKDE